MSDDPQVALAELGRLAVTGAAPDELMSLGVQLASATTRATLVALEVGEPLFAVRALAGPEAEWFEHEAFVACASGLARHTLAGGEAIRATAGEPCDPELEDCLEHVGALMCAPIRGVERLFGTLLAIRSATDAFGAEELVFLRLVANLLSASFEAASAEKRERDTSAFVETILDSVPDIVARFDTDLRHLYVSPSIERATGRPPVEFLGKTNAELGMPSELCEIWERELQPVIDHGRERRIEFDFGEGKALRSYEARAVPEFLPDGTVRSVVVVTRDITDQLKDRREREAAMAALERSERLAGSAFDQARIGMMIADAETRIVRVNASFLSMLDSTEDQILGQTPDDLTHPDDLAKSRAELNVLIRGEVEHVAIDKRYLRSDGQPIDVITNITVVRGDDGEVELFIGQVEDVSERRHLEAQLLQAQKLEAVGRLAGGIAHDFNNLLTGINGYADIAVAELQGPGNEKAVSAIRQVRKAGMRSAELTQQLLAFSRQQVMHPTTFSLNDIVDDYAGLFLRTLGEDVSIKLALATEPVLVTADQGQIGQVLLNLVVNARDALPSGGTIWVRTFLRHHTAPPVGVIALPSGTYVVLEVEDNGIGIDAATRERIFDPFFTTKSQSQGTGLGLATVLGIVEQTSGAMSVRSEPGLGTTFQVYLPVASGPADALALRPVRPPVRHHEHVLVVEDNDMVREIVGEMLSSAGFRVTARSTPAEALELNANFDDIEVLITDVVMPGLNGPELAQRLIALHPDLRVLYTSGYTTDVVRERGDLRDEAAFVQKPFSADELVAKLEGVLAGDPASNGNLTEH